MSNIGYPQRRATHESNALSRKGSKRKRTVFPSGEIPHLWAHKVQEEGRNSGRSLFFEGDTIYSYGTHFPIARHVENKRGNKAILFNSGSYSKTTSGHQGCVRSAIPRNAIVFTLPLSEYTPFDFYYGALNCYVSEIESAIKKAARARSSWKIKSALEDAQKSAAEAELFATFFDLKLPDLPTIPSADKGELKAKLAEMQQREAKRRAEIEAAAAREQAKRQREFEQAIPKWRAGEIDRFPYYRSSGNALLRLGLDGLDGKVVETSQGVRVPLDHAVRALRFVRRVVASGQEYQRNGHTFHIGHYAVDRITPDGTLYAGCHVITYDEINLIAPQLDPQPIDTHAA